MNVICVNDDWRPRLPNVFYPVVGESYTVIGRMAKYGHEYYHLEGADPAFGYMCRNFIPVSDIDETEREDYKRRQENSVFYTQGIINQLHFIAPWGSIEKALREQNNAQYTKSRPVLIFDEPRRVSVLRRVQGACGRLLLRWYLSNLKRIERKKVR